VWRDRIADSAFEGFADDKRYVLLPHWSAAHAQFVVFFLSPMAWPWMIDHGGPIRQQRY
jgi:hypothetical protein